MDPQRDPIALLEQAANTAALAKARGGAYSDAALSTLAEAVQLIAVALAYDIHGRS